ncbi:hypothetical protein CB1_000506006 [Camelus ferus]|nr:hypothetical protein CB1_000506006 [Camelus ferus]
MGKEQSFVNAKFMGVCKRGQIVPTFLLIREWDLDLKKLPNIKMRKICANDAVPKKCKKKTVTAVDGDLGELELKDESSDTDEEMTAVD